MITNSMVETAYDAAHAANCAGSDNRYSLNDRARALAYAYAAQEAEKNGLRVEGK